MKVVVIGSVWLFIEVVTLTGFTASKFAVVFIPFNSACQTLASITDYEGSCMCSQISLHRIDVMPLSKDQSLHLLVKNKAENSREIRTLYVEDGYAYIEASTVTGFPPTRQ